MAHFIKTVSVFDMNSHDVYILLFKQRNDVAHQGQHPERCETDETDVGLAQRREIDCHTRLKRSRSRVLMTVAFTNSTMASKNITRYR